MKELKKLAAQEAADHVQREKNDFKMTNLPSLDNADKQLVLLDRLQTDNSLTLDKQASFHNAGRI